MTRHTAGWATTFVLLSAAHAQAADPVQQVQAAQLRFMATCPTDADYRDFRDSFPGGGLKEASLSLGGTLLPSAAGALGDVVQAGLSAIGASLAEAARAQAFSVEGSTAYPFYEMVLSGTESAPTLTAQPLSGCLLLTLRGPHNNDPDGLVSSSPVTGASEDGVAEGDQTQAEDAENTGAELLAAQDPYASRFVLEEGADTFVPSLAPLLLWAEIRIVAGPEGFVLEPSYIEYLSAIPGAPRHRALPAELHVTFTTPSEPGATEAGKTFAAARVTLPPLRPGERWFVDQLGVTSDVLALRPKTGAATSLESGLGAQVAALAETQSKLVGLKGELAYVEGERPPAQTTTFSIADDSASARELGPQSIDDAPARVPASIETHDNQPAPPPIDSAAVKSLQGQIVVAERDLARHQAILDQQLEEGGWQTSADSHRVGVTGVSMRLALIRNENRFAAAVAASLETRAKATGDAVTAYVTRSATPAWSAAEGEYFVALDQVRVSDEALAAALTASDAVAVTTARTKLITDRISLNAKAVATNRPPPYPNPLR